MLTSSCVKVKDDGDKGRSIEKENKKNEKNNEMLCNLLINLARIVVNDSY